MEFSALVGKTITEIDQQRDVITFTTSDGDKYQMSHYQDCCEDVYVDDIVGDINDIVDTPIIVAEERSNTEADCGISETWTFYELRTNRGSVTIRWYGTSNGYYSESVDFYQLKD